MANTPIEEARDLHSRIMRVRAALADQVEVEVEREILEANLAELTRMMESWLAVAQDVHTPPHECATAELHLAALQKNVDGVRYRLAVLKQETRFHDRH